MTRPNCAAAKERRRRMTRWENVFGSSGPPLRPAARSRIPLGLFRLTRHVLNRFLPGHRDSLDFLGVEVHLLQVHHADAAVLEVRK